MPARIEIFVGLQYYLILGRNFVHLLSILVWNLWHCLVQLRAGTCLLAILDATHREVVRLCLYLVWALRMTFSSIEQVLLYIEVLWNGIGWTSGISVTYF